MPEKYSGIVFRNPTYKGRKEKDITGMRFGHLTAIRRTGTYISGGTKVPLWLFRCDCGVEREMHKALVMRGGAISCGCYKNTTTPNEYYIRDNVMHVIVKDKEFTVDITDKELVLANHWYIGKNGYVANNDKKPLHKMLMPDAKVVDHIDRNKLNNCRSNLRAADYSINGINKTSHSNTGHYGISLTKNGFVINILGKYAGHSMSLDEAIRKRNEHPLFAKVIEIRGATE